MTADNDDTIAMTGAEVAEYVRVRPFLTKATQQSIRYAAGQLMNMGLSIVETEQLEAVLRDCDAKDQALNEYHAMQEQDEDLQRLFDMVVEQRDFARQQVHDLTIERDLLRDYPRYVMQPPQELPMNSWQELAGILQRGDPEEIKTYLRKDPLMREIVGEEEPEARSCQQVIEAPHGLVACGYPLPCSRHSGPALACICSAHQRHEHCGEDCPC